MYYIRMKAVLLIALVAFSAASPTVNEQWLSFKRQHGKSYNSTEEEHRRLSIFTDNMKFVEEHNAKFKAGLSTHYLKMNHYGDMLPEEFTALGFNGTGLLKESSSSTFVPPTNVEIPKSVDWEKSGAVTPVKNEGRCQSSWAFSATGAMEGQLFIKTGKLVSLSEQQLVDCSKSYGNDGCDSGSTDTSFEYIMHAGGLESSISYPYHAVEGSCDFKKDKVVSGTKVKGYTNIPTFNDDALKSAVATVGPISVAVSGGHKNFQLYGGGVFDGIGCSSTKLDQSVLLVGYGSSNGQQYWLIKNSWGTKWGEEGYMKLNRAKPNACGISSKARYPVLE